MFVITVEFEVKPQHVEEFRGAVLAQAQNSVERESGCLRFDVCVDPENSARIFLYEIYIDEPAFRSHLDSGHYAQFDSTVSPWVLSKAVRSWELIADPNNHPY